MSTTIAENERFEITRFYGGLDGGQMISIVNKQAKWGQGERQELVFPINEMLDLAALLAEAGNAVIADERRWKHEARRENQ